jgi:hypothetical protein
MRIAPLASKMAARPTACLIVKDREPIDVAKALAASLAPIPIAAKKDNNPPEHKIHKYINLVKILHTLFLSKKKI